MLRLSGRAKLLAWAMLLLWLGFTAMGFAVRGQMPQAKWLFSMAFFACVATAMAYFVLYTHLYRVEVRSDKLSVHRFLIQIREIRWEEIARTRYDITEMVLCFDRQKGATFRVYLTLNGLWTIRKSVVEKCQPPFDVVAWAETEVTLQELAPAWIEPASAEP